MSYCILDGIYETDSINEKVINNQTFPYLKETLNINYFFFKLS